MARTKLKDLPKDRKLGKEEAAKVQGGAIIEPDILRIPTSTFSIDASAATKASLSGFENPIIGLSGTLKR